MYNNTLTTRSLQYSINVKQFSNIRGGGHLGNLDPIFKTFFEMHATSLYTDNKHVQRSFHTFFPEKNKLKYFCTKLYSILYQ